MQLKDDAAADLRVRIHMHKKLSKAVKHAQELQKLCNAKSDKKTILQAEVILFRLYFFIDFGIISIS